MGKVNPEDVVSIHGEEAAQRKAVTELIFFSGINDLERVEYLAEQWNIELDNPKCIDYDKRSPLHVACASGSYKTTLWLIEKGQPLNARDRYDRTPLEDAVIADSSEIVKLLIDKGAKIYEDGELVDFYDSKFRDFVHFRDLGLQIDGMEPEFEISPKEIVKMDKIGSGEFGEVFRGKWHGSEVAIKYLKKVDKFTVADLRNELNILRRVHHPNLVQFLGANTKTAPIFLVQELMSCSLVEQFKSVYSLPRRRAVELALDAARGMAYLHTRKQTVIHRDLKPANLMIGGNPYSDNERLLNDTGILKIADFGLSKTLYRSTRRQNKNGQENSEYKMTGETGSYRYMAPEVYRHETYDHKVDVYGYGMIAYQLFENKLPFEGIDAIQAAKMAAYQFLRPNLDIIPNMEPVQKTLRELVDQCWDRDPQKRPEFEEIVQTLEGVMSKMKPHYEYSNGGDKKGCCKVS